MKNHLKVNRVRVCDANIVGSSPCNFIVMYYCQINVILADKQIFHVIILKLKLSHPPS